MLFKKSSSHCKMVEKLLLPFNISLEERIGSNDQITQNHFTIGTIKYFLMNIVGKSEEKGNDHG